MPSQDARSMPAARMATGKPKSGPLKLTGTGKIHAMKEDGKTVSPAARMASGAPKSHKLEFEASRKVPPGGELMTCTPCGKGEGGFKNKALEHKR